jgi:hypothetical protein
MYACRRDWYALSGPVRSAIWATAGLLIVHPDRRAALAAAREEYAGMGPAS